MAAATASCVEIATLDQLLSYETVWRDLFKVSSRPSAFASWEWLVHWWRCFGHRVQIGDDGSLDPLLMIEARAYDGELVGLFPLYYAFQSGGTTRIPVLRMVGDVEAGSENPTEEPVALLKKNHERDAIAAVQSYLRHKSGGGEWNYASLALPYAGSADRSRLDDGELDPQRLSDLRLPDQRFRRKLSTAEMFDLPATWNEYRRSLSKSLRDNLKYYPRLIQRHGHTYEIRVASSPEEVRVAAATLIRLHRRRNASTHGIPHADHLPYEAHRSFLRDCLAALAERRMAAIYILEINGQAVAAQSILEDPEGLCFYYSGFDSDWHMYSPLTILAAEILRQAIDRGVTQVNLLNEAKPWKSRWGAKAVDRFTRTICIRWHLPSLFRCAALHCNTVYSRRFATSPAKRVYAAYEAAALTNSGESRLT